MEKSSGKSKRGEEGGGGSGSTNTGGNKKDDEEDSAARSGVVPVFVEQATRWAKFRLEKRLRLPEHRLHKRVGKAKNILPDVIAHVTVTIGVPDPGTGYVSESANPTGPVQASATRTSIINSGLDSTALPSSNQIVLSTAPPPSPVETDPATMSYTTVTNPNVTSITTPPQYGGPQTTITSFMTESFSNSNLSRTTWSFSQTTEQDTVVVYAFPTPSSNYTSISTSTRSRKTTSTRMSSSTTLPIENYGGGGAPTVVSIPSPTVSTSSDESGGPSIRPALIGGILGGLAGMALFLALVLLLLKRHKRRAAIQARVDAGYGGPLPGASMMQRSSVTLFGATVGFFRNSRHSRHSQASEPPIEERSFVKVSGRKLPPVIGGPRVDPNASMYQSDDDPWGRGPGTPVESGGPSRFLDITASPTSTGPASTVSPVGLAIPPGSAISPHSPFMAAPAPSSERHSRMTEALDEQSREPTPVMPRPSILGTTSRNGSRDGLGRSLPSHDGSRASRFTEDIV